MSDHSDNAIGKHNDLPPALRESIAECLNRNDPVAHIPAHFKTQSAREAFSTAFELTGGIPRFANWADKNYATFAALYSKLIPLTVAGDPDRPVKFDVPWLTGERFASMHGGRVIEQDAEPPTPSEQQLELFQPQS